MAGATNSIGWLAEGLAGRGHRVCVGCRKESALYSRLGSGPVEPIPMTFRGKFDRRNMGQIAAAVRERGIELINAQAGRDRYTSVLARWRYRLPVVVVHTRRTMPSSSGNFLQVRFYTRGTDGIVAVSSGVAEALAGMGIPPGHIRTIHNGTPPERYRNLAADAPARLRARWGIGAEETVIGCISRLKLQADVLRAAARLPEKKLTLVFCGLEENPELARLRAGLPPGRRVIYAGRVPMDDVLDYYRIFTVNVLPSAREGFPQALLEAMALEVPVIATDIPGNRELIRDGREGFLYAPGDEAGLSEKIALVIRDRRRRAGLVAAARRRALNEFGIDRTLAGHESYYRELMRRRTRPGLDSGLRSR